MENIVHPEELELFVGSIREFALRDVGSKRWLDSHEIIIKLAQQAMLEASNHRSESVSELLTVNSKLRVLVHEAYCILVWKGKILPRLLEIEPNPPATFLIYTTLFHEASVISLLDIAMFYHDACESLQDSSLDLIDYCAQSLVQLVSLVGTLEYHEKSIKIDVDEASNTEMTRQRQDLTFKIGMRCISIVNYIVESIARLPLSAGRRLVITHDIPWIVCEILHCRPWLRKTKRGFDKFIDETWTHVPKNQLEKITKQEAQTWFLLRQLLFTETLMQNYPLNDARRNQLSKCQGLLNDTVLDQLPPLEELKQFLCTLPVIGNAKTNQPLLLEEIPKIKDEIVEEAIADGGYEKIATDQAEIYLMTSQHDLHSMATRLNSAYNTDLLAEIESKKTPENLTTDNSLCNNCKNPAEQKCGNCKIVFYCSRDCQVKDWPVHKSKCLKETETTTNIEPTV